MESIKHFCSDLKLDFSLEPVSGKSFDDGQLPVRFSRSENVITATKYLTSPKVGPIAILIVRGDREITQQGGKALFHFLGVQIGAMIFSFLLLFIVLRKTVVFPLTSMTERAAELAAEGKGVFKLADGGLREIAVFTDAFNMLLGKLTQARDELEQRVVKRTEELGKAIEELRLMESVVENSPEGIVITDEKGVILRVNPAFTTFMGFRPDEVVGKDPGLLKSKKHDEEFYSAMRRSLMSKGKWAGEIWAQAKDGLAYPEWLSIVAVPSADKKSNYYIALFHDISDSKKREEIIRYQAFHDTLTSLPNRVLLLSELEKALIRTQRRQKKLVVLFMDLDHFKAINDTHGHETGDLVLKETARRFRMSSRESDFVARHGGDEFVIIMEDVETIDQVIRFSQRLIDNIDAPYLIGKHEFKLGLSIGGAQFPEDGATPEILLSNADLALYKAKAAGRNCLRLYKPELNEALLKRMNQENSLRNLLDQDLIEPILKPVRDLESSAVVGYEAVVSWRNGEITEVLASEIIKLARDINLSSRIDFAVLEKSLRAMALNLSEEGSIFLSLDISEQSLSKESLYDDLLLLLSRYNVSPLNLTLEVGEKSILKEDPAISDNLNLLASLGITLALDNFGSGYSSFEQLVRLPLNCLKIDASYIRNVPFSKSDADVVASIIAMAKRLSLRTVALGVENREQLEYLRSCGCDMAQDK